MRTCTVGGSQQTEVRNQTLACLYLPAQNRSSYFLLPKPQKSLRIPEDRCAWFLERKRSHSSLLTCQCKIMLHSNPSVSLWFPSTMSVPPIFTNSTWRGQTNSASNSVIKAPSCNPIPHPGCPAMCYQLFWNNQHEERDNTLSPLLLSQLVTTTA